jgi:hypothetical protein
MTLDRLRSLWVPVSFFVLASLTGSLLALLLPLGQAPDEGAHAIRVDALSHGRVLGHREGTDGGFTTPATLLEVARQTPEGQIQTRAERDAADTVKWDGPARFVELGTIATYFPVAYLPAALTVKVARLFQATPAQAFLAGRLTNVLVFGLLGTAALALAKRGRALIAATLLLPMSLGLSASLSGDGVLIGSAALAAACMTRGAREWWTAAGCLTLIGLTKLPYAPLLLVLFAPTRPAMPTKLGVVAVSLSLVLGWAAFNQATVIGTFSRPPYEAGPLWPGPPRRFAAVDPVAQLQVLRADPTRAITVVAQTLFEQERLWRQMIGVLGWLFILLPMWLYALWTVALPFVVLALFFEAGLGPRPALAGLLGVALSAWAVMLAQYLGWTEVGATVIDGLQGRYFLPLLPFFAVALPCVRPLRLPGLAAIPLIAGALGAATVPATVALASYLR